MLKCSSCSGFIPSSASSCPHCQASCESTTKFTRTMRAVKMGLIATGASMTLMACYGGPVDDYDDYGVGGSGAGGSNSHSGGAASGGHTSSGGQVSSDGGNGPLGGTAGALGGQGGAADLGGQGGQQ